MVGRETHDAAQLPPVSQAFQEVVNYVQQRGLQGVGHPFPHDLRSVLLGNDSATTSVTPTLQYCTPELVAEYGREAR